MRRKGRKTARRWSTFACARWCMLGLAGFFTINLIYQVIRKPVEIFASVSGALSKRPASTWQSYSGLFHEHSTNIITAEFLAALAQVESDGNPIARTYWRWQWSWSPFEIYRPASSAVGMFQMTDGTFAAARKYCIRDHIVLTAGPWNDLSSCWFNSLYARVLPSHAIEMTSAYLHQRVVDILAARRGVKTTLAQKQKLAAVIHLCGPRRGEAFAARGFRPSPGELCGTHNLQKYLNRLDLLKKQFARLAAA